MNKQIEVMRKDIYECDTTECCFGDQCEKCPKTEIAKALYNAGYRRQDEVAKDIFTQLEEEIEAELKINYRLYEKYLNGQDTPTIQRFGGKIDALRGIQDFIEELKKKYGVIEG